MLPRTGNLFIRRCSSTGMSFDLIPVCHPTTDITRPAVFIRDAITGKRELVGSVAEGLQRKCNANGFKTSRLEHIFLTGTLDWPAINGLPGLILTVSDQGLKKLGVFHSSNGILDYLISCWRFFVFRFGLDLDARDVDEPVKTDGFTMKPVAIGGSDHINSPSSLDKLRYIVSHIFPLKIDSNFSSKTVTRLTLPKDIKNPRRSISWIMQGTPVRGKFLVQKAKELGCQVEHFRSLCAFKSVTLKDGTVVTPEQVLEPTRTSKPVLFLEIPSQEYLDSAFQHNWLADVEGDSYGAVYHFLGSSIENPLENPKYAQFIDSFGSDALHFISHRQYCPNLVNYENSFKVSVKWRALMGSWFPLYRWSSEPELPIPQNMASRVFPMVSGQVVRLKPGEPLHFDMNTLNGTAKPSDFFAHVYDSEVKPLHLEQVESKSEFVQSAKPSDGSHLLLPSPNPSKPLSDQVETLVLGTGSALPSIFRNVLSNLLRIPYYNKETGESSFRCVLLDAGESTLGTIQRLFAEDEVAQIFDELQMVYLSHLHADHHMGIASIVQEWARRNKGTGKRLYIVTPWQYEKFLQELDYVEQNLGNVCYLSCDQFFNSGEKILPEVEQVEIESVTKEEIAAVKPIRKQFVPRDTDASDLLSDLRIAKFQTCYANHCEYAYSCSIDFSLGDSTFKVSYSGDSRPKQEFCEIGKDSDLLIHESTLEDDKYKDAVQKRHSTSSEATQVAILMKAKKLLLTHFSQRYRSFNSGEQVYKQLEGPVQSEEEPAVVTPFTNMFINQTAETVVPIQTKSPIFKIPLTEAMVENAHSIEVVFAFDNMFIQYGDFGRQREVIEREGQKLTMLFESEDKLEEEVSDAESVKSKKAGKKASKGKSNKKRKLPAK